MTSDKNIHICYNQIFYFSFLRELDFIKRQEVERKKIEDLEKAHLVEVQRLQVQVSRVLKHAK
jgi:hypothetical protein